MMDQVSKSHDSGNTNAENSTALYTSSIQNWPLSEADKIP